MIEAEAAKLLGGRPGRRPDADELCRHALAGPDGVEGDGDLRGGGPARAAAGPHDEALGPGHEPLGDLAGAEVRRRRRRSGRSGRRAPRGPSRPARPQAGLHQPERRGADGTRRGSCRRRQRAREAASLGRLGHGHVRREQRTGRSGCDESQQQRGHAERGGRDAPHVSSLLGSATPRPGGEAAWTLPENGHAPAPSRLAQRSPSSPGPPSATRRVRWGARSPDCALEHARPSGRR